MVGRATFVDDMMKGERKEETTATKRTSFFVVSSASGFLACCPAIPRKCTTESESKVRRATGNCLGTTVKK
jgi:hypothetical protein